MESGAHDQTTDRVSRADFLVMLSRVEWLVLRPKPRHVADERWFAWLSADAPQLALRVSAQPLQVERPSRRAH